MIIFRKSNYSVWGEALVPCPFFLWSVEEPVFISNFDKSLRRHPFFARQFHRKNTA